MANHIRIRTLIAFVLCNGYITLASAAINTSQETEQLLAKAVSQIQEQQPGEALATLDQLLRQHPHFQLAQMMRADLLLAQTNALTHIGGQLSPQQSQSLQAEARARLNASTQLAQHQQIAYLLGKPPVWLKHIISIDLASSRAYLFDIHQQQLSFAASFYVTQGSKGAGKEKEGDKRTPIGIYRIAQVIPSQKLSGFYGSGAFPLDYPNSWDIRNKRTGHGIWLHGTPFEQYSRPPLASDGCVVFSNDDMGYLLKQLDWQATRVVSDQNLKWKSGESDTTTSQLQKRIEAWRDSWEKQQLNSYISFYAADFNGQKGENKAQWSTRKQQLFALNQTHQIQIEQLLLLEYPSQNELVVAEFNQRYQRGSKTDVERKRLWWQQQQGEWLIIHEEVLSN
jgi:murein L,D-transpeptidase YafK